MPKKLIIHAGFSKTGTSALQQFWHLNYDRLLQEGILYPRSGRGGLNAHHELASNLLPDHMRGGEFDDGKTWDVHLTSLKQEIDARSVDLVLISSEMLSWQEINVTNLLMLRRFFDSFDCIFFIRNYYEYINSMISQHVKSEGLTSYRSSYMSNKFKFSPILLDFCNHVNQIGYGSIHVPIYDKKIQNDIFIKNFCANFLGLPNVDDFIFPDAVSSNHKLNAKNLEFKRIANKILGGKESNFLISSLLINSISKSYVDNWNGCIIDPSKFNDIKDYYYSDARMIKYLFYGDMPEEQFNILKPSFDASKNTGSIELSVQDVHDIGLELIRQEIGHIDEQKFSDSWSQLNMQHLNSVETSVMYFSKLLLSIRERSKKNIFVVKYFNLLTTFNSNNDVYFYYNYLKNKKNKPKLVLHIGFGKTGTSTLQNILYSNDDFLHENNILYPKNQCGEVTAHHFLAASCRPVKDSGYDTEFSPMHYMNEIAKEVLENTSSTIVLSSEIFSGRMVFKDLLPILDLFNHTTVVAYLRRQDEISMSSYQQWVKHGLQSIDLEKDLDVLPYHYDRSLKIWSDFLGTRGSILVRVYERSQLENGDVVDDFFTHALDLAVTEGLIRDGNSTINDRLGRSCFLFKNEANKHLTEAHAALLAERLIKECGDLDEGDSWDGSIVSPETRLKWLDGFTEGNAWIARTFLGGDHAFLFDTASLLAARSETWTPPTWTVDEAVAIATRLGVPPDSQTQFDSPQSVVQSALNDLFPELDL